MKSGRLAAMSGRLFRLERAARKARIDMVEARQLATRLEREGNKNMLMAVAILNVGHKRRRLERLERLVGRLHLRIS